MSPAPPQEKSVSAQNISHTNVVEKGLIAGLACIFSGLAAVLNGLGFILHAFNDVGPGVDVGIVVTLLGTLCCMYGGYLLGSHTRKKKDTL